MSVQGAMFLCDEAWSEGAHGQDIELCCGTRSAASVADSHRAATTRLYYYAVITGVCEYWSEIRSASASASTIVEDPKVRYATRRRRKEPRPLRRSAARSRLHAPVPGRRAAHVCDTRVLAQLRNTRLRLLPCMLYPRSRAQVTVRGLSQALGGHPGGAACGEALSWYRRLDRARRWRRRRGCGCGRRRRRWRRR